MTRTHNALATVAYAFRLCLAAAPGEVLARGTAIVVASVLPVTVAHMTRSILDGLATGTPVSDLLVPAIVLGMAGIGAGVVPHVDGYLRARIQRASGVLAMDRLYHSVNGLVGLARFEDPEFLSRLRIAQQAGASSPGQTVDGVLGLGRGAATAGLLLMALVALNPFAAALVVAAAVPAVVAEAKLSRSRARMYMRISPAERREIFYGMLLADSRAAKEIRLFDLGVFLRSRMLDERRRANRLADGLDRRELWMQAALTALAGVVAGASLIWAIVTAARGGMTLGDVSLFVAAIAGVQGALTTVIREVGLTRTELTLLGHYRRIVEAAPDLPVAAIPAPLPGDGDIEFDDVWFRYGPDQPWTLRGLTVTIRSGETTALVGLNGAGKSTVVKLLCRFYDPTFGSIRWGGTDLRDLDPTELRRRICAVFQDYMEYALTAADNIGIGDLSALSDRQRIEQAAEQAGVAAALRSLPHGFDTLLSREFFDGEEEDGGTTLSGGQWQRIALARALLKPDHDLLILDEPNSGLDAVAEHDLYTRVLATRHDRTTILISHRLNAVRACERLIVVDNGRVVETGSHEELMAADGLYARMFRLQANGYDLASADG